MREGGEGGGASPSIGVEWRRSEDQNDRWRDLEGTLSLNF